MSFFSMTGISKLFGGASLTEEERANLVKEVMLMTLARAAFFLRPAPMVAPPDLNNPEYTIIIAKLSELIDQSRRAETV